MSPHAVPGTESAASDTIVSTRGNLSGASGTPPTLIAPMSVQDIADIVATMHRLTTMHHWRHERARARARVWMTAADVALDPPDATPTRSRPPLATTRMP
ncbi:MAG: hypothetical protein PXZ08_02480 [Actinomycetota bacterium]|nr:hypothetical protein [Actinomycetota bacterium]